MNEVTGEQQPQQERQGDQQHLRARIRLLLSAREIPRVISSISAAPNRCDACGNSIAQGGTQVEVGFSTLTFRLDAQCFGIWAEEMLRSHPASEPNPKPKSAAG
jgi:hypothetical protein